MPLVRFNVRNEFGLGSAELYGNGSVEDEDPKAVLGGVEVAGLVGLLRQLGDLAEFAAEVFHGIQEQVTVTASRSQKLTNRVRRIESSLSPLEKAVLSQTSHIHFAYTAGCEWHPRMQNGQNHFIHTDLPLFVMESYEQCRDPPRLHLLDKFDVGGPGSCLRRYSDPTFFRKEISDPTVATDIKVQRDTSYRKSKKKRLSRRKIPRSRLTSTSEETSGTCPSSLTDDRQTTSQSTSTVGMACVSNMQELSDVLGQPHLQEQSDAQEQPDVQEPSKTHDSRNDSGYIEYLIHQSPMRESKEKLLEQFLPNSPQHGDSICSSLAEGCTNVRDDNIQCSPSGEQPVFCAPSDAWDEKKAPESFEQNIEDEDASEILESKFDPGTPEKETQNQRGFDRMDVLLDEEDATIVQVDTLEQETCGRQLNKIDRIPQYESERGSETESRSEVDEFLDARNTIESESDNDLDGQPKQKLEPSIEDINTHCLEDDSMNNNNISADIPYGHMAQDSEHDHTEEESSSVSYLLEDEEASGYLSVLVPEETVSWGKTSPEPGNSIAPFCLTLAEVIPAEKNSREEPVATFLIAAKAFPDESISHEETIAAHPPVAETVHHTNMSTKEPVAMYPLSAEAFHEESPEVPVVTDLSLSKAIPGEKMSPKGPIAMRPLSAEAFLDERISPEESVAMSPSLESVPHQKISSEEPVAMYPLLEAAFPDESPEESVSTDLVLANVVLHGNLSMEEPLPMFPLSTEDFLDESIPPDEPIVMYPSLAEAVLHEKVSLEESTAIYPLSVEAFRDEGILPQEPFDMDLCLTKAIPHENVSPEELVATCPSSVETVPEDKNSLEESDSTYPSSGENVPGGNILSETQDASCCSDGDHATDDPNTASGALTDTKSIGDSPNLESTKSSSDKTIPQVPGCAVTVFDPHASSDVDNNLKGEFLAPFCSPSISGDTVLDANCPVPDGTVKSCPDAREFLSSEIGVESVTIWSNGSLLGLEPSKPPVFAVPNSVNGDMQNQNNGKASVIASKKKEPDGPVESNGKVSEPSSQQSSRVSHSNGSHQQSNAISFGVFGLSHRLLMNGFRRNLSACNYEALPATSNTEVSVEDETEHGYQEARPSTFNEPFGSESFFDSPTSSPPLEHMTISFRPIDGFAMSKLKLKIPPQPQRDERKDMFPLFQLVPETASPHNNATDSEDDNDTFCRSSPCISVSCRSEHSVSDTELWESDGNPEMKDGNLCSISPGELMSSFELAGDKNTYAVIGMEPSLSESFLDIPCFDAVDSAQAVRETQNDSNMDIHEKLPSHIESTSWKLLGSLEQDNGLEPDSCESGDWPHALPYSSEHGSSREIPMSISFAEPPLDSTASTTSEAKHSDPRSNSVPSSPPMTANAILQVAATDGEDD